VKSFGEIACAEGLSGSCAQPHPTMPDHTEKVRPGEVGQGRALLWACLVGLFIRKGGECLEKGGGVSNSSDFETLLVQEYDLFGFAWHLLPETKHEQTKSS